MPDRSSELVAISKLNGDFRRNYGKLIGAFLYLRSISATRGRSFAWLSMVLAAGTCALPFFQRYGLSWLCGH